MIWSKIDYINLLSIKKPNCRSISSVFDCDGRALSRFKDLRFDQLVNFQLVIDCCNWSHRQFCVFLCLWYSLSLWWCDHITRWFDQIFFNRSQIFLYAWLKSGFYAPCPIGPKFKYPCRQYLLILIWNSDLAKCLIWPIFNYSQRPKKGKVKVGTIFLSYS